MIGFARVSRVEAFLIATGHRISMAPPGSVFRSQHDGQHSGRPRRVARIFAFVLHLSIVVVDLPEDPLASVLERSEVAFPVWIVVRPELVERFDQLTYRRLIRF